MAWSIFIPCASDEQDALVTAIWERGTTGIIEEAGGLRAFFEDTTERAQLGSITGTIRVEADGPYSFKQEDWEPILIGQRFIVAPPWVTFPADAERFRLAIDASTAFGTGRHETTQLCIEALESYLQAGDCVLDIGGGSGILSAAASLLGAGLVFTCDIHEDAIATARQQLRSPIFLGSADAVRSGVANLVLANISARVLDHIAADLRRILKPTGLLLASGFIEENVPKRFRPFAASAQGEWLCWACRVEDIDASPGEADSNVHAEQWWV
jgi:ribosomal protein L11 methylase PrmA